MCYDKIVRRRFTQKGVVKIPVVLTGKTLMLSNKMMGKGLWFRRDTNPGFVEYTVFLKRGRRVMHCRCVLWLDLGIFPTCCRALF